MCLQIGTHYFSILNVAEVCHAKIKMNNEQLHYVLSNSYDLCRRHINESNIKIAQQLIIYYGIHVRGN